MRFLDNCCSAPIAEVRFVRNLLFTFFTTHLIHSFCLKKGAEIPCALNYLKNTRDCDTIILRLIASSAPCVGDSALFEDQSSRAVLYIYSFLIFSFVQFLQICLFYKNNYFGYNNLQRVFSYCTNNTGCIPSNDYIRYILNVCRNISITPRFYCNDWFAVFLSYFYFFFHPFSVVCVHS